MQVTQNHKKAIYTLFFLFLFSISFTQNQNVSNGNVFDGEPYLAINPNNSQHIVVAWMGWINFSNQFKIKTKTSFDGGKTWSNPSELPHTVSGYSSADPSVAFNSSGDIFVCYIDFTGTTPPVTGGVYICRSTDGGLSWQTPTEVINTNYDGTKWPIDRPWMVIDCSNGTNDGNIYVSSMNLNRNNPSFRPYLSISTDTANTFTTKYLDTTNFLAGSINPLPMCSPTMSSTGVFYGSYPSYLISQSPYAQTILAKSTDAANSFNHSILKTFNPPTNIGDYPNAKKASLLICNPVDENHLAFLFLSAQNGDLDVFISETKDAGATWSSEQKINDDPIGNNKMQDLIWGDFDTDGDLIVSWRDRRNANDSTYQTTSEIWAAFREKDSQSFSENFQITNETAAYDTVLESAGNDFMCIKLQDDTLNAAWGDTRDGKLNIWFQRMTTKGEILTIQQISSMNKIDILVYPNPTNSIVMIEGKYIKEVSVYNILGEKVLFKKNKKSLDKMEFNLEKFPKGNYFFEVTSDGKRITKKILKE